MSRLPASLKGNAGKNDPIQQQTPAEVSAMQTAEKMVTKITSSFAGRRRKDDDSDEIGDGSRKLETGGQERSGAEVTGDLQREANDIKGKAGLHGATQGCEDCG